jgi:hypothetical protein
MSGAETSTVVDVAALLEDLARAGRMMRAAELADALTPEDFAQWMERGQAIRENKEAPDAHAGKQEA